MSNTAPKNIKQRLSQIAFIIAASYFILLTSVYIMQERLLFLPTHLEQDYRFEFNYPFEELFLEATDGALLNGVHFKVAQPKGVILYFHGNAGEVVR